MDTRKEAVERAVVAGLAYADLFDYCLDDSELQRLAVGERVTQEEVAGVDSSRVERRGVYWVLVGREELLGKRAEQRRVQGEKLAMVGRWAGVFRVLPWVQLVAVTGSVAGGNPGEDDDIDLLIICQVRRLWVSRLLLSGGLSLLGKRRKPNHNPLKVKDLFCLNMWLSESDLVEANQNIYLANELARMKPVVNRRQMYERYLEANDWLKEYLPNVEYERPTLHSGRAWPLIGSVLDMVDRACERLLRGVMKKPTQETVSSTVLKFHPRDYQGEVLEKYERRLLELKKEVGVGF